MIECSLKPGLIHQINVVPTGNQTAHAVGNHGVHVIATIFMIGFIEECCGWLAHPHLQEGQVTVGTHVNLAHLAAIGPGKTVNISAELTAVEGKKLIFEAVASHKETVLMRGTHTRHIVELRRLMQSHQSGT